MSRAERKAKKDKNTRQEVMLRKHNSNYLKSGETDNYARIFKSMIYDPKYNSLPGKALLIYQAMVCESKGGDGWFTFPKSRYDRLVDKNTFGSDRDRLVENGFIDMKRKNNGTRTEYKLSDRWKDDPVPPPRQIWL